MNMKQNCALKLDLGERSYPIYVDCDLLPHTGGLIASVLAQPRVFIVTDENVAPLYLNAVTQSLSAEGISHNSIVLPPGERTKDFNHLQHLLESMLAAKSERHTTIIALGGGVIGDLAGFAAAILLRGVDFVQIPTTLLAQVDSSVGGKTGINTKVGKNLVGSFHQPRMVISDIDTLTSLPRRQLLAGYSEVCKYSLIDDADFFAWLELNSATALGEGEGAQEALRHCIVTGCSAKSRIVAKDELEKGQRALLNLGHTFGHALEAELNYSDDLLHGEAVAIGIVMAFDLSVRLGFCPSEDAMRVRSHFECLGLPTDPPKPRKPNIAPMKVNNLLGHMSRDKKVYDGKITFVLTRGIGKSFLTQDVRSRDILEILETAIAT